MIYHLTEKQIKTAVQKSSSAIYEYCKKYDKHYLITGVSGGLDSGVTLALAEKACNLAKKDNYQLTSVGLIMPCFSDESHAELARQAIQKFNSEEILIPLDETYTFISSKVTKPIDSQIEKIHAKNTTEKIPNWSRKISQGNIKVRLRMMCGTYHVARMLDGIVLSTDNYSELLMGFWTLNGDVGDYGAIQHIFKGLELYDIAAYLEVPQGILKAKPTDGLGLSDGDEAQLGADYPTVDRVMIELIQNGFEPDGSAIQLNNLPAVTGIDDKLTQQLASRCLGNSYKRKGTHAIQRDELGLPPINKIIL